MKRRVQEFLRVGYYAQTEYEDELLRENPPDTPDIDKCATPASMLLRDDAICDDRPHAQLSA